MNGSRTRKITSDTWARVILAIGYFHRSSAQVDGHVDEVEVERDADQEHAQDEHRRTTGLRIRARASSPSIFADRHVLADLLRRGVREGEGEQPEHERRPAGQVELDRGVHVGGHGLGDPAGDPPDGREHLDLGEVPLGVPQVVQRQRVAQGQGRGVSGAVQDEQRVEGAERRWHCGSDEQHGAAGQAEDAEHLLGREVAVGDQADEERGDHGADGERAVRGPDLAPRTEGGDQVGRHARRTTTPR